MPPFGSPAALCNRENGSREATGSSGVAAQSNCPTTPEINPATQVSKDGSRQKTPCGTCIPRNVDSKGRQVRHVGYVRHEVSLC
jgi:hypothetical protein